MPTKRLWDTGYWSDSFIQKLPKDGKLLFWYLAHNEHCLACGLYYSTLETICFETGIEVSELPGLLKLLEPKIIWYGDHGLVWIKNFIKRQLTSAEKWLPKVAKDLTEIKEQHIVQELLQYNLDRYGISIPYATMNGTSQVSSPKTDKTDDLKVAGMIKYYKNELGKMLTPLELDKLKDFADTYPDGYFEKAVNEVKAKKNIKSPIPYMGKIMENRLKEEQPVETSTDNQGIETI